MAWTLVRYVATLLVRGRPAHIITPTLALTSGTRLGPYEVVSAIGSGGMGEVYRAHDTKLGRDVALKVLPDAFAHDTDRLARFKREAQVLASLNHPHIAQIYGIEESGPVRAIVMELVDGATLAEVISRAVDLAPSGSEARQAAGVGPRGKPRKADLPLAEALPIARQIAEALVAAHELGIIHRDLKPANVKITDDGTVKVLDFGLAKPTTDDASRSGGSVAESPTLTSPAATALGLILGTAAYMAPEQAKGQRVDKRADVWAFGCVLYEMLSGRRAFAGDDVSDTLASVLKTDPDWGALPADLPRPIRLLIERSLVKDRRRRVGDISTALFLLDEAAVLAAPSSSTPAAPRRAIGWLVAGAAVCLVAGATLATIGWQTFGRPAAPVPCSASRWPCRPIAPSTCFIFRISRSRFRPMAPRSRTSARTQVRRPSGALSFESVHSPASRSAICPGRFSLTIRFFRQTDNPSRFSRPAANSRGSRSPAATP